MMTEKEKLEYEKARAGIAKLTGRHYEAKIWQRVKPTLNQMQIEATVRCFLAEMEPRRVNPDWNPCDINKSEILNNV